MLISIHFVAVYSKFPYVYTLYTKAGEQSGGPLSCVVFFIGMEFPKVEVGLLL